MKRAGRTLRGAGRCAPLIIASEGTGSCNVRLCIYQLRVLSATGPIADSDLSDVDLELAAVTAHSRVSTSLGCLESAGSVKGPPTFDVCVRPRP